MLTMPMILYRSGVGLEDFKLSPGICKPVDVDPSTVFSVIQVPDTYASTEREEARSVAYADRDAGVTPESLGISTAERPVASETMARQEEANKKFLWWIDNDRSSMKETVYKIMESFAQYQPTYSYVGEDGQVYNVEMPRGNIRDTINVDLTISNEVMNMETRREVALMKFQLVKSYNDSTMQLVQAICAPTIPSDFKKYLLANFDNWNRLLCNVLENFDERDPKKQVVDIKTAMDIQNCMMNSADILAQKQAMQQQAMAQQGIPPGVQPDGQPVEQQGGQPAGQAMQ